jgi:hypothetical protein
MPEPRARRDALDWLTDLLKREWHGNQKQPPLWIGPRSDAENIDVEDGDWVLIYYAGDETHQSRGEAHRRDDLHVAIDLRSETREGINRLKDEAVRVLEHRRVRPDPYGEWDQMLVTGIAHPSDFPAYQQKVIDVQLVKFARTRATAHIRET